MFNKYPYINLQDINLDWLIETIKKLRADLDDFVILNTIKYADPINWDITRQYETNTIVVDPYDGTAYLSVRPIPTGVSITNTDYWTPIFNYGEAIENLKTNVASNEKHSTTATKAYIKDSLVWFNDDLYITLTDLPIGTAFVVDENIELCTVENFIKLLIDQLKTYVDNALDNITTLAFDTVADMAASTLIKNGDIVKTLGYYSKNDGGGAFYKILNSAPENYYETCGNLFAELITGDVINVLQFGAIPNDPTKSSINNVAIQKAFDTVNRGGTVYFPKIGLADENSDAMTLYHISTSLTFNKTYATITSEPATDYCTALYAENLNDYILKVTSPGVRIENIHFRTAVEPLESFTNVDGILFDRTSVRPDSLGANLDVIVSNCNFLKLRNCITAKGRNVKVEDCLFSNSKNGIIIQSFVDSDDNYTIVRGIRILGNRFHSMGGAYRSNLDNIYDDLSHLDSWCIETPMDSDLLQGVEVNNNYCDLSISGFYKGFLTYAHITNNMVITGGGVFIRSLPTDPTYVAYCKTRFGVIANNMIEPAEYAGRNFTFRCIDISEHRGIVVSNNSISFAHGSAIAFTNGVRLYITGNTINNAAKNYPDDGVIHFSSCSSMFVSGNSINGQNNNCYGIIASTGTIWLKGNSIANCIDSINVWSNVQTLDTDHILRSSTSGIITSSITGGTVSKDYCMRKGDVIVVSAMLTLESAITANNTFFNIPANWRPSAEVPCIAYLKIDGVATPFLGKITTAGEVRLSMSNTRQTTEVGFYACYGFNI